MLDWPPASTLTHGAATQRIAGLVVQVKRLEETHNVLLDQFRRWQCNVYVHGAWMDAAVLGKPLPSINRSGHRIGS